MDSKRNFEEYIDGIDEFVNFATHTACDGRISCPCRTCRHKHMHDVEVVHHHLYTFRMLKNDRTWVFHGEFESATTTSEGGSSRVQESLNQYGDFHGMLHDLHPMYDMALDTMDEGPSVQQGPEGPIMQQPVEGSNDDAKKFYNRIDVEKPSYKGCMKFSIFSTIVVLYHLKTLCGWTNKSFTLLLQVLQDLLPSDTKLSKDCYEAKKIIKYLGIHACPNDCMLYWKENSNLDACPHYELPR